MRHHHKDISLDDVIYDSAHYHVMAKGEKDPTPSVEYIDEDGLPKVHFSWVDTQYIFIKPGRLAGLPDEIREKAEKSCGSSGDYVICVYETTKSGEPKYSHRYFCNFRRYSWASSTSPSVGYMSRGDVDYVNAPFLGPQPKSPEDVVRLSFAVAVNMLEVPRELVAHIEVKALLRRLLDDALDHIRPEHCFAAMRDTNGAICDVKVQGKDWSYREHREELLKSA